MKERNLFSAIKTVSAGALLVLAASSAAAQTASTTYRGTSRDPFIKYRLALKRVTPQKVVAPVPVPPIQTRIDNYKAQKLAAIRPLGVVREIEEDPATGKERQR